MFDSNFTCTPILWSHVSTPPFLVSFGYTAQSPGTLFLLPPKICIPIFLEKVVFLISYVLSNFVRLGSTLTPLAQAMPKVHLHPPQKNNLS